MRNSEEVGTQGREEFRGGWNSEVGGTPRREELRDWMNSEEGGTQKRDELRGGIIQRRARQAEEDVSIKETT